MNDQVEWQNVGFSGVFSALTYGGLKGLGSMNAELNKLSSARLLSTYGENPMLGNLSSYQYRDWQNLTMMKGGLELVPSVPPTEVMIDAYYRSGGDPGFMDWVGAYGNWALGFFPGVEPGRWTVDWTTRYAQNEVDYTYFLGEKYETALRDNENPGAIQAEYQVNKVKLQMEGVGVTAEWLGVAAAGAEMSAFSMVPKPSFSPLADKYEAISPYTYALNDPINAIDPDGRLIIFVNGFMPNQWVSRDNRKTVVNFTDGQGVHTMSNPNYRPYPGERNFTRDSPQYLGQSFTYWGNETHEHAGNIASGIGGLFSQAHNDYNTLFVNASHQPNSKAYQRFDEGMEAGNRLIEQLENGETHLGEDETIKLVGHSHGAAFAAGMAWAISKHDKYSSRLEVVYYLAPDQPNQFRHPKKIKGIQISTKSDWVSSAWWSPFSGPRQSKYQKISGVSNAYGRENHNGGRGGHSVDTYLDDLVRYFRNLGINVTVYE